MLDLRELAAVRGGRRLFAGVQVQVPAGGLLRVRGANGAGKTSLLRMLCGLLAPAAGEVHWRGQPIAALAEEFHRELVYIGHAAALKDELSPIENLQAAATLGGAAATLSEAAAALAAAGLKGRERLPSRVLSQGQRKRVALARLALPAPPGLWVLDEPFNALDVGAIEWLLGLIRARLAAGGVVVLTSHQSVALDDAAQQQVLAL
ncbi:MAG TPA: cytochrome c biogenesis heme-transporting ATPase CcmA [Methylibium sp.]|nr:cytochrome c biogenesis heme-transporting ATPase CcmA [Methylibium sp.]